ncbi:MAG TPA: hypothetical protein VFF44_03050 [Casimicrobiaceae bacterium]|nr:hypothetical protein [Casimicrobiaceae bacterium]
MRELRLAVACGGWLLAAGAAVPAHAEPIPGPPTDLYPGTREYEWTFYVPVVTTERREIVLPGPNVAVRSRQLDYQVPGLRTERRKLGQVAEFYCKYPDWQLPNECGVAWRDVYADFPQLTMRREHIDVDVAEWSVGEHRISIFVPHWTWTPRTLTLVVPVLSTEPPPPREWRQSGGAAPVASVQSARDALEAGEAASREAADEALAALGKSIATIEGQGGDAAKLAAGDGSAIDLYALRQTLIDQKTAQATRYARIRSELDAAGEARTSRAEGF